MIELRRQRPIDPIGFARRMEALQTSIPTIACRKSNVRPW
jgi:hypothetical protein